jgi:hypothetical protein
MESRGSLKFKTPPDLQSSYGEERPIKRKEAQSGYQTPQVDLKLDNLVQVGEALHQKVLINY